MIDIFTVVLPHALMAIAVWRLIHCDELDLDPILPGTADALARKKRGFGAGKGPAKREGPSPDSKAPRA